MSVDAFSQGTRIYVTGSCEGLNELTEALTHHPEMQLVGRSQSVREGAGALAGGHLPPCCMLGPRTAGRRHRFHPRVHPGADRPPCLR